MDSTTGFHLESTIQYEPGFTEAFDKALIEAVRLVCASLRADFCNGFEIVFRGWKRYDWCCHLLKKAAPYGREAMLDAVDNLSRECAARGAYPPNFAQIEAEMRRLHSERRRANESAERLRASQEKPDLQGQARIAQMREKAFARPDEKGRFAGRRKGTPSAEEIAEAQENWSRHEALAKPYSIAAQRHVLEHGNRVRFDDRQVRSGGDGCAD